MFRLKTIFGGKLRRRCFENQAVELFLQSAALKRMLGLGKPDSYKAEDLLPTPSSKGVSFSHSCNKAVLERTMRYSIMLQLVSFLVLVLVGGAALFGWLQSRPDFEQNRSGHTQEIVT